MVAEGGWSPRRVHCESTAVVGSGHAAGRWSLRFCIVNRPLLHSMEYNFTHTQLRSCWPGPDRGIQGYSVDQDKVHDTPTHKPVHVHVHVRTKAPHISVTDFQHSPAIWLNQCAVRGYERMASVPALIIHKNACCRSWMLLPQSSICEQEFRSMAIRECSAVVYTTQPPNPGQGRNLRKSHLHLITTKLSIIQNPCETHHDDGV